MSKSIHNKVFMVEVSADMLVNAKTPEAAVRKAQRLWSKDTPERRSVLERLEAHDDPSCALEVEDYDCPDCGLPVAKCRNR